MSDSSSHPHERPELAALADGSLDAAEAEALAAEVDRSPELQLELGIQRRSIELTERLSTERAPDRLRARIDGLRQPVRPQRRRRWFGVSAIGVAVAAAATLAVLLIPGGVADRTILTEAAAAQGQAPASGPPNVASDALLDLSPETVEIPNWEPKFQWRATGVRVDDVRGRRVTTVLYEKDGKSVGYGVVSGDELDIPREATSTVVEGSTVRTFTDGGRTIVAFPRKGHTCVVSAIDVPTETLHELAGWKAKGNLPFESAHLPDLEAAPPNPLVGMAPRRS